MSRKFFALATAYAPLFAGILSASILLTSSCQTPKRKDDAPKIHKTQIVEAKLSKVDVVNEEPLPISLSFVDRELPNASYQGYLQTDVIGETVKHLDDFPSTKRITIKFPALTRQQFDKIKRHYGNGLTKTVYKEGTEYTLTDFLTPIMQGTIGHTPDSIHSSANCWGTLFEVQRQIQERFYLFYVNEKLALSALTNPKYSDLIATIPPQDQNSLPLADMQYLDAILVLDAPNGKSSLVHAATFIDNSLIYEKHSLNLPYRLSSIEQLKADYPDSTIVIRRFKGKEALPSPLDLFGGDLESAAEVQLKQDGMGRFVTE